MLLDLALPVNEAIGLVADPLPKNTIEGFWLVMNTIRIDISYALCGLSHGRNVFLVVTIMARGSSPYRKKTLFTSKGKTYGSIATPSPARNHMESGRFQNKSITEKCFLEAWLI